MQTNKDCATLLSNVCAKKSTGKKFEIKMAESTMDEKRWEKGAKIRSDEKEKRENKQNTKGLAIAQKKENLRSFVKSR